MDDELKPTAGIDEADEAADEPEADPAEETEDAEEEPARDARQAPVRKGQVRWYAHNGQEFAVREGTPEQNKLERALARPLRGPSEPKAPASKAKAKPAGRSTRATRG